MSRREVAAGALLALGAAALSAFTILRGYGPHDEGFMLAWARRMADGQWPYRDFWSNYAPGQPLLLAALVKLFGPSLLWWRLVRVAFDATVSVLAFAYVRRHVSTGWALTAGVSVAGAMAWPSAPTPNPTALALGLGALLLAPSAPLGGGALAALAIFVRPEIGVASAIGTAIEARAGATRRPVLRVAVATIAVAVLALAPFAIVAGGDMVHQVLGFASIQDLQRLPFPLDYDGPHDLNKLLEFYFPAILVAGSAEWAVWALVRRDGFALAALVAVGVAYLLARTDEFHLVPLSVALAMALAWAAGREGNGAARAALAVALGLIALHGLERRVGQARHPPALAAIPAEAADGVKTDPADAAALRRLIPYVRARAPRGEPVLVAPPRYDRVRVGDPMLNVLLDRPNPTRYDVVQPGVVTTAKVQREMARDLGGTPVVVRWLSPLAREREPNGSSRSSGVFVLDRAIARGYRPTARFGDYVVFVRR
ncbi:MAG TPA: hypothetical protein VF080_17545 [Solirubrobacteraceae bacterium]